MTDAGRFRPTPGSGVASTPGPHRHLGRAVTLLASVAVSITTLTGHPTDPDRPARGVGVAKVPRQRPPASRGRSDEPRPRRPVGAVVAPRRRQSRRSSLPGDGRTVVASLDTRFGVDSIPAPCATRSPGGRQRHHARSSTASPSSPSAFRSARPAAPTSRCTARRHRRRGRTLGFTLVLATAPVDGGGGCDRLLGQPVHAAAADPHRRGDRGGRPRPARHPARLRRVRPRLRPGPW